MEGDINSIVQSIELFSHTDKLEIPELVDAETYPPKNLQYYGATTLVGTQPFLLYYLLEDTSVASSEPPTCPRFEARYAALQESAEDLLDVCLLGANDMLFSVYQDWGAPKFRNTFGWQTHRG